MIRFKNDAGVPFVVICTPHEAEPGDFLVKFFDARYAGKAEGWDLGQPVSSYYASTLMGETVHSSGRRIGDDAGLCLQGDVPAWQISAENARMVVALIEGARFGQFRAAAAKSKAEAAAAPRDASPSRRPRAVQVMTDAYRWAHGVAPRGRGVWCFFFRMPNGAYAAAGTPERTVPTADPLEAAWMAPQSPYGEAKRWAIEKAREIGAQRVEVAS